MAKINDLSEKQDKELVELLMNGSNEVLGELYARYKDRLMFLCKRCLKNEADAEDVVHDIFLRLWEKRHTLGNISSFSGFVQTMAQNYATDKLRHSEVHSRFAKNMLVNTSDLTNETEDSIINNDYTNLLNELMEKLPPMQKKIFQLNRIEGLTYQQISELLQMPVGNVRRYAALASKKIKDNLSPHIDILFHAITTFLLIFL